MDYRTVTETAEKWGISSRRVHEYLTDERINGAARFGYAWMIPSDAKKPEDPRRERKHLPLKSLNSDVAEVIAETAGLYLPWNNPDSILDTVKERYRLFYMGWLAYLRGDYIRTKQCFTEITKTGDDAMRLRAGVMGISAAISTGDYPFYLQIESYCKSMIESDLGSNVKAIAEYALATAYGGTFVPVLMLDWQKSGDISAFPRLLKPEILCRRTGDLHFFKKYESVFDVAQTAMAYDEPERGLSFVSIHQRIYCAAACCSLFRYDEAKKYLHDVMFVCLPRGFIVPLAEELPLFGGLMEQVLELDYPAYYADVTGLSERIIPSWLDFHNHFTKDNITLILTRKEYQIALLVARRVPYAKIAELQCVSVSRIKGVMGVVYDKLFIRNRNELAKYVF